MSKEITFLKFCSTCRDEKGHSKPILEKDVKYARQKEDGKWVCGVCITHSLLKLNEGNK